MINAQIQLFNNKLRGSPSPQEQFSFGKGVKSSMSKLIVDLNALNFKNTKVLCNHKMFYYFIFPRSNLNGDYFTVSFFF